MLYRCVAISLDCCHQINSATFVQAFSEAVKPMDQYLNTIKAIISKCQLYARLKKGMQTIHEGIPSELTDSNDALSTCSTHSSQAGDVDCTWWKHFIDSLPENLSELITPLYKGYCERLNPFHNEEKHEEKHEEKTDEVYQKEADRILVQLNGLCRAESPPNEAPSRLTIRPKSPHTPPTQYKAKESEDSGRDTSQIYSNQRPTHWLDEISELFSSAVVTIKTWIPFF